MSTDPFAAPFRGAPPQWGRPAPAPLGGDGWHVGGEDAATHSGNAFAAPPSWQGTVGGAAPAPAGLPAVGSMGHISGAGGSSGGFGGPAAAAAAAPSGPFGGATQSFTALTTAAVLSAAASGASPTDLASNPLASLAVQKGGELVTSSLAKYMPGALALWRSLRYYFHVNNSYVRNKLSRLLFPFSRKWERSPASAADQDAGADVATVFATPANDVNAPDLYIPLMAFVTFVLATGLLRGIGMKFHPEVLSDVMSRSSLLIGLEVALLRAAMYALGVSDVRSLDLLAFGGYKFVGLVINMLAGIFFGRTVYYVAFLYTAVAIFWFTVNTLVPLLRGAGAGAGGAGGDAVGGRPSLSKMQKSQRNYLAVIAALLQVAIMWWLGDAR